MLNKLCHSRNDLQFRNDIIFWITVYRQISASVCNIKYIVLLYLTKTHWITRRLDVIFVHNFLEENLQLHQVVVHIIVISSVET